MAFLPAQSEEEPFWEYIGGPEEGLIYDAVKNPANDDIYIRTYNGIYLSTDKGESWERYFWDINTISRTNNYLVVNPAGILLGCDVTKNNQLYLSFDKGETKEYLVNCPVITSFQSPKFDMDGNIYFVDYSQSSDTMTIWFSSDTGNTWISYLIPKYNEEGNQILVPILNYSNDKLVMCTGDVYGQQGRIRVYYPPTSKYDEYFVPNTIIHAYFFDDERIYSDGPIACFFSNDKGKTWEERYNYGFGVSKVNDSTFYIPLYTYEYNFIIIRTTDNGISWDTLGPGKTKKLIPLSNGEIVGIDPSIYKSNDTCKTWARSTSGFSGANIYDMAYSKDGSIYAVNWGVHKSTDNGDTWHRIGMENKDVRKIAINQNNDLFVYTQRSDGIYRSTNDGNTWENYGLGLMDGLGFDDIFINKRGYIYVGYEFSGYFISRDNGLTWTKESPDGLSSHCFSVNSEGHIFRGDHAGIVSRSTDDGDSWQQMTEHYSGDNCFWDIKRIPFDPHGTKGWALCMKTTDNGRTWEQFNYQDTEPFTPTNFDSLGNYLIPGWRSTDKGKNWEKITSGLNHKRYNILSVSPNGYYFLGAENGGLYRSRKNYVSVEPAPQRQAGTITPNPATDYIDVILSKAKTAEGSGVANPFLSVKIYDVLGVCVLTHPLAPSREGETVRLDVSGLAAGVYFVRVGGKMYKFVKM